jgi:hypothetical protein
MSEASRSLPQHFLVLNDKGGKYQLKLEGLALLHSVLFCLEKPGCLILPSIIYIFCFQFLFLVDLRMMYCGKNYVLRLVILI